MLGTRCRATSPPSAAGAAGDQHRPAPVAARAAGAPRAGGDPAPSRGASACPSRITSWGSPARNSAEPGQRVEAGVLVQVDQHEPPRVLRLRRATRPQTAAAARS